MPATAYPDPSVGDSVMSCPRAGCERSHVRFEERGLEAEPSWPPASFGPGRIGAAAPGLIAEHLGILFVYQVCALLPLIGLLAALLPDVRPSGPVQPAGSQPTLSCRTSAGSESLRS